jgi:hypothetical protein
MNITTGGDEPAGFSEVRMAIRQDAGEETEGSSTSDWSEISSGNLLIPDIPMVTDF